MENNLWPLLAGIVTLIVFFVPLGVGAVLVVRDTIRQRGKWGINTKPVSCTECGTPMPMVRKPANWRRTLWGGGTCSECGFELDKWGRPIEGQNAPAKWKVLRAADEAERRPRRRDERIRDENDHTQRGDAL